MALSDGLNVVAPLHAYLLSGDLGTVPSGEVLRQDTICLVVMKRLTGILLALPVNSIADDALQDAQLVGPDEMLGPSHVVEIAGSVFDLTAPGVSIGEPSGELLQVLLVDASLDIVPHLNPLDGTDLDGLLSFQAGDPTCLPSPDELVAAVVAWITGSDAERMGFYSAVEEEVPETPSRGAAPNGPSPKEKARPKALPGTSDTGQPRPKKKPTVASLAESLDQVVGVLPALTEQVQKLVARTEKLEASSPARAPEARPSALRQPSGAFPSRGLSTAPSLSSFVDRMPPPKSSSGPRVTLPPDPYLPEEVQELAADHNWGEDQGDLAKAIMMQSQALTTLVTQIAANSGDAMQDLANPAASVGSRGAVGRAKLQQELALHRGTFFQAVLRSMSRRMHPALTADLSSEELAKRGVTPTQYLERFGGFGKTKDIGHTAWQVGLAMEHLQQNNVGAAQDCIALLLVCLEQTAMDSGNMQVGLLLSLTEDPPQSLFSNRSLAMSSRPRAFAPTADQKWITCALQFLKELDTISARRLEVAAPSKNPPGDPDPKPTPKKKQKGGGKGKRKSEKSEEQE